MTERRLNVLFIFSDQHAQRVCGCYGDTVVATPNIDAIAKRGARFDKAYCPSPLCAPSRMAMLTGRLPSQTGCLNNTDMLRSDIPTFAHVLSAGGYETVCAGRLHSLGPDQMRGFGRRLAGDASGNWIGTNVASLGDLGWSNNSGLESLKLSGAGSTTYHRTDDEAVNAAVDYLTSRDGRAAAPFFLYVGLMQPHTPYIARRPYFDAYRDAMRLPHPSEDAYYEHDFIRLWKEHTSSNKANDREILRSRAAYYGMVARLDQQIGELLQALAAGGHSDNTLIIYSSDHGDHLGERGLWWKHTLYEDSVKIPLVMCAPGYLPGGQTIAAPVSLTDLFGTFSRNLAADAAAIPSRPFNDLIALARGSAPPATDHVAMEHYSDGISPWGMKGLHAQRAVRTDRYKYIYYHGYAERELYDLDADPLEQNNLAGQPQIEEVERALERKLMDGWKPDALIDLMASRIDDKRVLINWARKTKPSDLYVTELSVSDNYLETTP